MRIAFVIAGVALLLGCGHPAVATSSTGSGSSGGSSSSAQSTGGSTASASTNATNGGSTSSTSSGSGAGSSTGGTSGASNDLDQDGLDDAQETQLATDYLPYISLDPADACAKPDGFVVRVSPHPGDASRPPRYLEIRYDHLYQTDCGTAGHVGDDENIAITVDTTLPAPQGIMMIKAISHRNTPCEHTSKCVQQSWSQSPCNGYAACDVGPLGATRAGFPVVYRRADKAFSHGTMVSRVFRRDD